MTFCSRFIEAVLIAGSLLRWLAIVLAARGL